MATTLPPATAGDINAPLVVATDLPGAQSDGANGTTSQSLIQAIGSNANDTGFLQLKYGDDAKGGRTFWAKTRGSTPDAFDVPCLANDRIGILSVQASTGTGQTGHVGEMQWTTGSLNYTIGEWTGVWAITTGTGISQSIASPTRPHRYGVMTGIIVNERQQVQFPGGIDNRRVGDLPVDQFGATVAFPLGGSLPGEAPARWQYAGGELLATPEPGRDEVDPTTAARLYTPADGVRRAYAMTTNLICTAALGPDAGTEANGAFADCAPHAYLVGPNCGSARVRLGFDFNNQLTGMMRVNYPVPFANMSEASLTPANPNAAQVPWYVVADTTGFTIYLVPDPTVVADVNYKWTFNYRGS